MKMYRVRAAVFLQMVVQFDFEVYGQIKACSIACLFEIYLEV